MGTKETSLDLLNQGNIKLGNQVSQTGRDMKQSTGGDVLSPAAQNFRNYVES